MNGNMFISIISQFLPLARELSRVPNFVPRYWVRIPVAIFPLVTVPRKPRGVTLGNRIFHANWSLVNWTCSVYAIFYFRNSMSNVNGSLSQIGSKYLLLDSPPTYRDHIEVLRK